jgi:hypothetical protein
LLEEALCFDRNEFGPSKGVEPDDTTIVGMPTSQLFITISISVVIYK